VSYTLKPTVVLGTNRFENCEFVLALEELPLLSFLVEDGVLQVTLEVPSPPATIPVAVHANISRDNTVRVKTGSRDVTIFAESHVVLMAKLVAGNDRLVEVDAFDLRPVGLTFHADATGLYAGRSVMNRNVIRGSKIGISLG